MPAPVLPYTPDPRGRLRRFFDRLGSHLAFCVVLIVVGICGIVLCALYGPTHPGTVPAPIAGFPAQPTQDMDWWVFVILLIAILVALVGSVATLFGAEARRVRLHPNLRSDRINRLNRALTEALQTIDGIQREVEDGQALLQSLQEETGLQADLAVLQEPQVKAIKQALERTLRRENRSWLPISILINLGCAAIGLVVGH